MYVVLASDSQDISVFFLRVRNVVPSPAIVLTAPYSWLGSVLIISITSLLGLSNSHRGLCGYLDCYLTIPIVPPC
jgi:hypothetical protein